MTQELPRELTELMEAACNGELTGEQFGRLEHVLRSDANARAVYVRYMGLDADLWLGASDGPPTAATPAMDHATVQASPGGIVAPGPWPFGTGGRSQRGLILSVLLVGLLVSISIAVTAWLSRRTTDVGAREPEPTPVAFLTRTVDARWHWPLSGGPECGHAFLPGRRLELLEGLAEITFDRGARTILQGPTVIELQSADAARLQAGRLVGHVPPEAAGFAVRTPSTTVVDMGTEFGLEVDRQGAAEVMVFEGEVDVERPPQEDPQRARAMPESFRLTEGQSARIAMDRIIAAAEVDPDRYVRNVEFTRLTRAVVLREDFSADKLDPARWQTFTWAPRSSVRVRDGTAELLNRGYLATVDQFDPVKLGGIRITGKWRFITPDGEAKSHYRVNIMTIVVRGDVEAGPDYFETRSGIALTCFTSSRWASIAARGGRLEVTKDRKSGRVERERIDVYRFEVVDDGKNLSFKFWDPGDPQNVAQATATVTRDASDSNHVVFYCREPQPPDWTYKALLDDVVIETGVGPIR